MSKLDDALTLFGLRKSDLHYQDKIQLIMRKRILAAHPDKGQTSGENIHLILEARNIIQAHMKYYKPFSVGSYVTDWIREEFLPSEDARVSLVEMIRRGADQNIFSVGSTIDAILASGHLAAAINMPDEYNNTPLHVAAMYSAITKSSAALFGELLNCVKEEFDFAAINNEQKTLYDVIEEIGRGNFRVRASLILEVAKRTKVAMIDKALHLIEETVKDNIVLPKGLMAIKHKFLDSHFQSLSAEEKLKICQDIIRERNTYYEGYLGIMYSFFSRRQPEMSKIYQSILNFHPLKTKTMVELESIINSSDLAWKGMQIAYQSLLCLKESPEQVTPADEEDRNFTF